ncbi:MAG TPA: hypothetical protein VHV47_02995, partial [Opitutaceae bacterium]|nr:hypothetical protein [Opitutaceae bacterium]
MPLPTPVISDGLLPIDVSALPASAEALAKTLEAGNTGVPSLDQEKIDGPDPAFERAVLLLLAPMIGAQPRFSAVTYQAIALLPGVVSLGTVSTHSGKTGQGFAAGKGANAVAIVVSRTGTLLEVRNFRSGAWNGL